MIVTIDLTSITREELDRRLDRVYARLLTEPEPEPEPETAEAEKESTTV